jgi:ribokinase
MRELPSELVALVDVLLVNTGEAQAMLAQQGAAGSLEAADPAELATALRSSGRIVVVTAGAQGAALARPGVGTVHVTAEQVRVVDTTGAGDAFAGALAGLLARGVDIGTCVREATAVAGKVVATAREDRQRHG